MPGVRNRRGAQVRQWRLSILLIVISGFLGACGVEPTPTPVLSERLPTTTVLPAEHASPSSSLVVPSPTFSATLLPLTEPTAPPLTNEAPSATSLPAATAPSASTTPRAPMANPATTSPTPELTLATDSCLLGTGLRGDIAPIVVSCSHLGGLVQASTVGMAEAYFPRLGGWIRALGAPSLEGLRQKAEEAERRGVRYEALSYGLETSRTTPEEEWQDLIGSTEEARAIADEFGKLLVMGPGFRLMSQNWHMYPAMAALADIWVLQTQRLQVNPPGSEYRQEVQRIVNQIRTGNPDIWIWAQITLPPDREPDADEWLAYHNSIADLVEGTYLGVYTWSSEDPDLLVATIESIFAAFCY